MHTFNNYSEVPCGTYEKYYGDCKYAYDEILVGKFSLCFTYVALVSVDRL